MRRAPSISLRRLMAHRCRDACVVRASLQRLLKPIVLTIAVSLAAAACAEPRAVAGSAFDRARNTPPDPTDLATYVAAPDNGVY